MNLLDLMVTISVNGSEAEAEIREAKENIIKETGEIGEALSGSADEVKNALSSIADEDIISSMLEGFTNAGFLTLFAGGLKAIEVGLAVTAAGAAEAAEKYVNYRDSLIMTKGPIEDMQANLETLRQRHADLQAEMAASGGYGFDMKTYSGIVEAIDEQEVYMVAAAFQNLADTYTAAKEQVSGWFAPFQEAAQIQTASLDTMAANIQSQIDYNRQYQESLETLTDAGYGELAAQMQELGQAGAGYLQAFAEAVSEGDTEAINSIQTLMGELSESQTSLATTITETSGAFDQMVSAIETATGEPFEIEITDNATEVAESVTAALASIPDEEVYINVIRNYLSTGGGEKSVNSHNAQGLDYVPFDGYISSLHRGERIMTANENKAYSQGQAQTMPQEIRVVAPIAVQIDRETIAYATYDAMLQIESDRGGGFVRSKR